MDGFGFEETSVAANGTDMNSLGFSGGFGGETAGVAKVATFACMCTCNGTCRAASSGVTVCVLLPAFPVFLHSMVRYRQTCCGKRAVQRQTCDCVLANV